MADRRPPLPGLEGFRAGGAGGRGFRHDGQQGVRRDRKTCRPRGSEFSSDRSTCGSEPARESYRTTNIYVECECLFASKLAPTGFCIPSEGSVERQTAAL